VPGLDSLVFPNRAGNPLISSSFWQHHFKPALDAVGLACRFHDLRHTSVALAIAEGAHPKAIQVRMGHSSINVTLDATATCSRSSTRRSQPGSASGSQRSAV
jgi:integrase